MIFLYSHRDQVFFLKKTLLSFLSRNNLSLKNFSSRTPHQTLFSQAGPSRKSVSIIIRWLFFVVFQISLESFSFNLNRIFLYGKPMYAWNETKWMSCLTFFYPLAFNWWGLDGGKKDSNINPKKNYSTSLSLYFIRALASWEYHGLRIIQNCYVYYVLWD